MLASFFKYLNNPEDREEVELIVETCFKDSRLDFDPVLSDLAFYYYDRGIRCISRNAIRLHRKLEKFNLLAFPAVFKVFTNFRSYPESYRFWAYVLQDGTFCKVYFFEPVAFILSRRIYDCQLVRTYDGFECFLKFMRK